MMKLKRGRVGVLIDEDQEDFILRTNARCVTIVLNWLYQCVRGQQMTSN